MYTYRTKRDCRKAPLGPDMSDGMERSTGRHLPAALRRASLAALFAVLAFAAAPARAGDLAAFLAAVGEVDTHGRTAAFYLRTDNPAVAGFELDEMTDKWRAVVARFGSAPPDAFADDPAWRQALGRIGEALATARGAASEGDAEAGQAALAAVRGELATLRQRNNVWTFSDCIDEIAAQMSGLWRYRHAPPDLASTEVANRVKAQIGVLSYLFTRCRERAPRTLVGNAEFEHLIDGSLESLSRMWATVDGRDAQAFVSYLRGLRSFERLLFLRFG